MGELARSVTYTLDDPGEEILRFAQNDTSREMRAAFNNHQQPSEHGEITTIC